jgi:carbon monoxide dehydrogenase subunit G
MISTEREILVRSDLATVWEFVQIIGNWANQMPGYVSHKELDPDQSDWTLNVQMGPFSRPIVVKVQVIQWKPGRGADFTLDALFEPFHGEGSISIEKAPRGTLTKMHLGVEVTGSMSKVLTVLAGPVLQRVADEFSTNLCHVLGGSPDAIDTASCQGESGDGGAEHANPVEKKAQWWRR